MEPAPTHGSAADTRIASHFDALARTATDLHAKADWGSEYSQRIRLSVLLEIGVEPHSSILDVGCGTGALRELLRSRGHEGRYVGIDLSPEMVRVARARAPNVDFHCVAIDSLGDDAFDFVIASGIHYLRTGDNEARAEQLLRAMYARCKRGVATNFLSRSWTGGFGDHVFAYDPPGILKAALAIAPRVVLRHDYLPNDFSVFLLRESE